MSHKYYVRIYAEDKPKFQDYLVRNGISAECLSVDIGMGKGSSMYSIDLTYEEASAMKLSFNLVGLLNLKKVLDAQLARKTLAQKAESAVK
jgi:fibronectin type 3 domain-containing protein